MDLGCSMWYLILVIILNTYIFTVFKLFDKLKINALQAITVNYWTCVITGSIVDGYQPFTTELLAQNWAIHALFMGGYFIFTFNLMSYSTAKLGMTVTTVGNKLSLVIPVLFSYFLYQDSLGILKIAGIILAIPAVYMATKKTDTSIPTKLFLPFLIFICSGLLDTALKYMQHYYLHSHELKSAFTITTFAVAAILGTIIILIKIGTKKDLFSFRNVIAGILLGIPNYFSILYLIKLFGSGFMQSSAIIPVNNIGIVVSTTLVAILVFKETRNWQRMLGITLAIIAILLIAVSEQ